MLLWDVSAFCNPSVPTSLTSLRDGNNISSNDLKRVFKPASFPICATEVNLLLSWLLGDLSMYLVAVGIVWLQFSTTALRMVQRAAAKPAEMQSLEFTPTDFELLACIKSWRIQLSTVWLSRGGCMLVLGSTGFSCQRCIVRGLRYSAATRT